MYYIQQTRKDDCGYASLKMLLASLNKDKNYLFLQEEKEKGSYSYLELVTIAKQHDVELNGYRIDSLKQSKLLTRNPFLLTIKKDGLRHMVLVRYIGLNLFQVYDPKEGKMIYRRKTLEKIMSGTVIIVKSFAKKKAPMPVISKLSLKNRFILNSLRLVSLILVILSALFLHKVFSPILPIILLVCALIFEFIYRIISLKIYRQLDDMLLDNLTIKEKKYYAYYKLSQNYKTLLINNGTSYIFTFILFGFLFYLLAANDLLNLIPFCFTFLFVCFETLYLKRKFKRINASVERKEKMLQEINDTSDYRKINNSISLEAIKGVGFISLTKLSYFFILILLLIINMIIKNTFELTYVLFYFFFFGLIKKVLVDFISYPNEVENINKTRAKLISMVKNHNDFENE